MSPFLRFLLPALPALAAASLSRAAPLDDLVKNSPFMPPGQTGAVVAPTENAAVEFRGMITTPAGVLFGLYDRTMKTGAWVRQDDKGADFRVRSYDPASDMVAVDYHGQKFNLTLSPAKIGTMTPSAVAGAPGMQPVTALPAARVDDRRRLESIAAEVRRRRALRQGAAQAPATQAAPTGGRRR